MADPTDGDAPVARKLDAQTDPDLPKGADDPDRPRASESGDPGVQKLLGDRENAKLNQDSELVAGIDKRLAALGYHRSEQDKEATDG